MKDTLPLLNLIPLVEDARRQLGAAGWRVQDIDTQRPDWADLPQAATARFVLTNGTTGLSATQMDRMPKLELICAFGAGYENIDVGAAKQRDIAVAHAPNTNSDTVADHALALMLAVARGLVALDRAVKGGGWAEHRAPRPTQNGSRLGIVGLGHIGAAIAARAAAFGMHIGYHTRTARPEFPWCHYTDVSSLAQHCDFLVLACPGGPATHHLVDATVLDALGSEGFLINVARGSVVDTTALITALQNGAIAGAALDVYEHEPDVPAALRALDNVVLTPHVSGRSPAALQAQIDTLLGNLQAHLDGRPLVAAVPS